MPPNTLFAVLLLVAATTAMSNIRMCTPSASTTNVRPLPKCEGSWGQLRDGRFIKPASNSTQCYYRANFACTNNVDPLNYVHLQWATNCYGTGVNETTFEVDRIQPLGGGTGPCAPVNVRISLPNGRREQMSMNRERCGLTDWPIFEMPVLY